MTVSCFIWTIIFFLFLKTFEFANLKSSPTILFKGAFITWNFSYTNYPQVDFLLGYDIQWNGEYVRGKGDCDNKSLQKKVQMEYSSPKLDLECESGCTGQIGSLYSSCLNTQSQFCNKWPSRLQRISYTFPNNIKSFVISFQGCCWPTLADKSESRPFKMKVQGVLFGSTSPKGVSYMTNLSPPLLDPSPVVLFKIGCTNSYVVPVIDFDDDIINCVIKENPLNLPGISIDQNLCVIKYSGVDHIKPGYYPLLIEIQEFSPLMEDSQHSSAVQVYLLIEMIDTHSKKNYFVDECEASKPTISSPLNFTCFAIPYGSTMSFRINGSISLLNSIVPRINFELNWAPSGVALKDFHIKKINEVSVFSQLVVWTPSSSRPITRHVSIYATTSQGQRSERLFITVSNLNNCFEAEGRLGFLRWMT